jgi:hypothetical protein
LIRAAVPHDRSARLRPHETNEERADVLLRADGCAPIADVRDRGYDLQISDVRHLPR